MITTAKQKCIKLGKSILSHLFCPVVSIIGAIFIYNMIRATHDCQEWQTFPFPLYDKETLIFH